MFDVSVDWVDRRLIQAGEDCSQPPTEGLVAGGMSTSSGLFTAQVKSSVEREGRSRVIVLFIRSSIEQVRLYGVLK